MMKSVLKIPFKNPLVVGYKGEIGSYILQGLLRVMPKAQNIWCIDINESEKSRIARIKRADYVFLCVPLKDTVKWLLKYKPYLKDKRIVEQCSLKTDLYTDTRFKKLNFIGMHIMFRPSATPNIEDRELVFIDNYSCHIKDVCKDLSVTYDEDAPDWWCEFIEVVEVMLQVNSVTCYTDVVEHDRDMAVMQALTHRVLLVLGRIISKTNVRGGTYVTKRLMNLVHRIKGGEPDLYNRIQNNIHLDEPLKKFKKELGKFELMDYVNNKKGI